MKPIQRLFGLLWLLGLRLLQICGRTLILIEVDVDCRQSRMRLDAGVRAVKLDGLLAAGDGIDSGAQDVCLRVAIDFAGVLLQQDELRLSLKGCLLYTS